MHIKTEMATSHEGVPAEAGSRSNYGGFTISTDKVAQKEESVKDDSFAVDFGLVEEVPPFGSGLLRSILFFSSRKVCKSAAET